MITLLASVLPKLLEKGFDCYKEFNENKELKAALKEQIMAELRFNNEILYEIGKVKNLESPESKLKFKTLHTLLITEHFDAFEKSGIPLKMVFDGNENISNVAEFLKKSKSGLYKIWADKLKTEADVTGRIYHRIKILKALQQADLPKHHQSYGYIHWLHGYLNTFHS